MAAIDPQLAERYEHARRLEPKPFPSLCYAPFTSLYFNTDGSVVACCKNTGYVLGNVKDERLPDIWHGKRAQAMRKALRSSRFPPGCELCEWQVRGGENAQGDAPFENVYARTFDRLPVAEDNEWPAMMEFTVSNTCNLACIMCYGTLSSTIRAHREKLPPLPKVYDDRFFEDLRPFLAHLKTAKFFGGEPFLAKENYRIWDLMIEDGIRIPIHVTTNGTQFNSRVERILSAFDTHLSISVDGATKETVESVRVNAKHDEVLANIRRFRDYTRARGTTLTLPYCLMRQNWHEFADFLAFAEDLGCRAYVNTVVEPAHTSLYTLEPAALARIADDMETLGRARGAYELRHNQGVYATAVASLHAQANDRQREDVESIWTNRAELGNALSRGWQRAHRGEYDAALREADGIAEDHQDYYQARVLRAHALRALGRRDEAASELDGLIERFTKQPHARVERGWLRLEGGDYQGARTDAEDVQTIVGDDAASAVAAQANVVLAVALLQTHQFVEALATARVTLPTLPDDPYLHLVVGLASLELGDPERAREAAERASSLAPDHPVVRSLRERVAAL